jgi:hypothetical protein
LQEFLEQFVIENSVKSDTKQTGTADSSQKNQKRRVCMAYQSRREWIAFREEWKKVRYCDTIDSDSITTKQLQSLLTWGTPPENMPPELITMILALEKRISELEERVFYERNP